MICRFSCHFKLEYGKEYQNQTEDRRRMQIFLKNKRKIDDHNEQYARGLTSFKMGLNKFADLLPEEMNVRNNRFGPRSGRSYGSKKWSDFKVIEWHFFYLFRGIEPFKQHIFY